MSTKFPKFKLNDEVKTKYGSIGKIIQVLPRNSAHEQSYQVRSRTGIEMRYMESELSFYHPNMEGKSAVSNENLAEKCPKCGTKWTKTMFGSRVWYDCIPCGKTAEELSSYSPPPVPKSSKELDFDDLLKEFEDMLDDDDDFGIPF